MADDQQLPAKTSGELRQVASQINIGAGALAPRSMAEVMDFAQLMAKAGPMVGTPFRGNPGACIGITMQAMRWNMDPFAVSQKAYVLKENIAYEAQLVAAVINANAPIKERPKYEFIGEGTKRRCIVRATFKSEATPAEYTSPEIGSITTKNSPLWKSDPDQQLGYYSLRSWARRHCPEIIMGVYTPDEIAGHTEIDGGEVRSAPLDDTGEIIPELNSNQAKRGGLDTWITHTLLTAQTPADIDAMFEDFRWKCVPPSWHASYAEMIEYHKARVSAPADYNPLFTVLYAIEKADSGEALHDIQLSAEWSELRDDARAEANAAIVTRARELADD